MNDFIIKFRLAIEGSLAWIVGKFADFLFWIAKQIYKLS